MNVITYDCARCESHEVVILDDDEVESIQQQLVEGIPFVCTICYLELKACREPYA